MAVLQYFTLYIFILARDINRHHVAFMFAWLGHYLESDEMENYMNALLGCDIWVYE